VESTSKLLTLIHADQRILTMPYRFVLCYNCHAEYGHYNPNHPRGNKYKEQEIKKRRDQIYEEHTRHLVPVIDFQITQEKPSSGLFELPRVGFRIGHVENSLSVWVLVNVRVFLGNNESGAKDGPYFGKQRWSINPRQHFFGNFRIRHYWK